MSGKPAARVTDMTACPLPGHASNPIVSGSPDVLFDGLSVARMTDTTACGSALVSGVVANVLINGLPVATLGTTGNHGNVVVSGSGSVIIGQQASAVAITPVIKIPGLCLPCLLAAAQRNEAFVPLQSLGN